MVDVSDLFMSISENRLFNLGGICSVCWIFTLSMTSLFDISSMSYLASKHVLGVNSFHVLTNYVNSSALD